MTPTPARRRARRLLTTFALASTAAVVWGICPNPSVGPDVIVGSLYDTWGNYVQGTPIDGNRAYSIGTKSVNVGDQPLLWQGNTSLHPVIGQNLYRLRTDSERPGGRLEQIGMSWLKHGFTALAQSEFCACTNPGTGSLLGLGCSDPYSTGLNGSNTTQGTECGGPGGQGGLGARSEVNPTTGQITYPYRTCGTGSTTLRKRLIVADADLDPTAGVRYFGEAQYIASDDAAAGNGLNNASFREAVFSNTTSKTLTWGGAFGGTTQQQYPAIAVWPMIDSTVEFVYLDTARHPVQRFHVARKVHDFGNGSFRHEYAVHNLNSDLAAGRFVVHLPAGAVISNVGFHDVDHHSGEPYATTDWSSQVSGGNEVVWWTEPFGTNANANALRWGTMFNFWFDATVGGDGAEHVLQLFKPGCPQKLRFTIPNTVLFEDDFECQSTASWSEQV